MKYAIPIARVLLGLPFLIFGINYFLMFMEPPDQPQSAQAFLDALTRAEFMHPIRSAVEAISGGLLVLGLFVPLALVMLAPILVHVIGYHLYLDSAPESLAFSAVLTALSCVQAWAHRLNFKCLLNGRPRGPERN